VNPRLLDIVMTRTQQTIAAIRPGVRFPQEDGAPHAPIVSDIGGRAHTRLRSAVRTDISECPAVEIVYDYKGPTKYIVLDNDLYARETSIGLFGVHRVADAGDSFDSTLRPALNGLRSDLAIAALSVPFWPAPDSPEALINRLGRACRVTLVRWWTDPAIESSEGYAVVEFLLRVPINRHKA
jgi:hypothetical protein